MISKAIDISLPDDDLFTEERDIMLNTLPKRGIPTAAKKFSRIPEDIGE